MTPEEKAISLGYYQSDKEVFEVTPWKLHNVFIEGANWMAEEKNKESVNKRNYWKKLYEQRSNEIAALKAEIERYKNPLNQ